MKVELVAGAKKTRTITKKHVPLIWEGVLGTVYARNDEGVIKYFHYDYNLAKEYAGVSGCEDLRVCRATESIQTYPQKGKAAVWGIRN